MELVSIVVPIYNSEKYLKSCCRSILKQTYKTLEIILVDDGSRDNSLIICQKLAKHDNRIKIISISNQGVSVARNRGIESATGKYICFVDSDDILPKNAIETLFRKVTGDQADFCQGSILGIYKVHNKTIGEKKDDSFAERNNYDSWRTVIGGLYWGPVAALYKTDIIKKHGLFFCVGIKLGEDSIFLANYLAHCDRVSTCKDYVYLYNRINTISATRKGYKDAWKWLLEFTVAYQNLYPDQYQYKQSAVEEMALRNLDYVYEHYVNQCQNLGKTKILYYLAIIHNNFEQFLNCFSSENIIRPASKKLLQKYKDALEIHAYEEIYEAIKKSQPKGKKALKNHMKSIIAQMRYVRYFGLQNVFFCRR